MNKFSLLLFFSFFSLIAQKEIITITSNAQIYQSFNVVDSNSEFFAVFLEESNLVKGYLYDKNYQLLAKIYSDDLPDKYKNFIGYQIKGKTITLFMNSQTTKNYGVLIFDFEKETSHVKELDFKLKKEVYFDAISVNNSFHLMTRVKNKNQFNVYTFNEDFSVSKNEIVIKKEDLLDRKNLPIKLVDFTKRTIQIENKSPISIEATSEYVKIYNIENKVIITSDIFNEFTQVISINLDDFSYTSEKFLQPKYESSTIGLKSNSYLYENYLFQLISNSKKLTFQVSDLATKEVIKEYSADKDNPIDFKNSEIILEGGDFKKYRELEKSSQFLRKISKYKVGISVYKNEEKYQITAGGITESVNGIGYYMAGAVAGGMIAGYYGIYFNPMTFSYFGYANTKSVRITGLFDNEFNHIQGEIDDNPFEIINTFFKENKDFTSKTVFNFNGNYIYGFYNKNINLYEVFKI